MSQNATDLRLGVVLMRQKLEFELSFKAVGDISILVITPLCKVCSGPVGSQRHTDKETPGFNKYYPPDYDDSKHGSLNSYKGQFSALLVPMTSGLTVMLLTRQTCPWRQGS